MKIIPGGAAAATTTVTTREEDLTWWKTQQFHRKEGNICVIKISSGHTNASATTTSAHIPM